MASSEPLVPTNLPQGSRQAVREGMVSANIPLAPPVSRGAGSSLPNSTVGAEPPPGAGGPLDILLENGPEAFPFVTMGDPETAEAPSAPRSVVSAIAASSQSSFGRAVAERLAQILEG